MRAFRIWCHKHQLCLYVGVVMVPVLLSLGRQYRSLTTLEFYSVGAHRWTLGNYLHAVASGVASFYRTQAERALKLAEHQVPGDRPRTVATRLQTG